MGTQVIPNYIGNFGAVMAPGAGEQIGQALAQFGQGIGSVIDPYEQFHTRLREAISANPDLLQRFADLAHENPDAFNSLGRMIPKDVMGSISTMTPSPESIKRRGEASSLAELEKSDPATFQRWMKARALGVTPTQEVEEEGTAPQMEALGKTPTSQLPHDLTPFQAGAVRKVSGETAQGLEVGEKMRTLTQLGQQYLDGLDDKTRQQIGAYATLPGVLSHDELLQRQQFQNDMLQERNADRIADMHQRFKESLAENMSRRTNVGTFEDWLRYDDPKVNKRAQDLADGRIPVLGDEDTKLRSMALAERALGGAERGASRAGVIGEIVKLQDEIGGKGKTGPLDPDRAKALTEVLNYDLQKLHERGGPNLKAEWTAEGGGFVQGIKRAVGAGQRLVLKDAAGQEVSADDLKSTPLNPDGVERQAVNVMLSNNPRAQAAWARIQQSGDIERGLALLREQEDAHHIPLKNGLWYTISQAINAAPQAR